jgi:competence protein ComEC
MKKTVLTVITSCIALIGVYFFSNTSVSAPTDSDELLHVYMFDVGQGDSLFVKTPEHTMIIDGGPDSSVVYEVGKVLPFFEHEIDYMILSHPHNDHVNGLNDIIDRYVIGEVFHSGVLHTLPSYTSWLQKIIDHDIATTVIKEPRIITLSDGVELHFLAPVEDFAAEEIDSLNNASLVLKVVYKDTSYLFTGDMERELEAELLAAGVDVTANVLKVGHHGSISSTTQEFLSAVAPEVALISAAEDSPYGHPHDEIIDRLESYNIEIYQTGFDGTVHLVSDGEYIWVE